MKSSQRFLLIALFFVASSMGLRAQNLLIVLDSLYDAHSGLTTANNIPVYNNDSIYIYCHVINHTGVTVNASSLSFLGFCSDTANGQDSVINAATLSRIDTTTSAIPDSGSANFELKLLNTGTNPTPNLAPSGNSVVIWPIYGIYTPDSATFELNWQRPSAISDPGGLYDFIGYNAQNIWIQFTNDEPRTVALYDATGQRILQHPCTSVRDEIDWSTLPDATYILYIRNDEQSVGVKLLHLGW